MAGWGGVAVGAGFLIGKGEDGVVPVGSALGDGLWQPVTMTWPKRGITLIISLASVSAAFSTVPSIRCVAHELVGWRGRGPTG